MATFSAKEKAIAIAPKFTSLLSVAGSVFIVEEVIRDKKKQSATFHRLLLGMSICDILASSWFFAGPWPIPAETVGVYGASGTHTTCVVQGFFSQFSLSTVMYNASLSVYYFLKIARGWKDRKIKKVEPILHAFALAVGIGTSAAGIFLNLYNNDIWECWIAPLPFDCKESWKNNGETDCVRGDNASLYRWAFYYAPLWAAITVVTIAMVTVYRTVRGQETLVGRHEMTPHSRRMSKRVANQGYWYCGAFYITWFFPTITRLTQLVWGRTPYGLIILTAMFVPIQGLFNFIVYIHPRTREYGAKMHGVARYVGTVRESFVSSVERRTSASARRVSALSIHLGSSTHRSILTAVTIPKTVSENDKGNEIKNAGGGDASVDGELSNEKEQGNEIAVIIDKSSSAENVLVSPQLDGDHPVESTGQDEIGASMST